jgi:hypothetical protein
LPFVHASTDGRYPDDWPPRRFHTWPGNVSRAQVTGLAALVGRSAGETELDRFLRANPEVLSAVLWFLRTGHHGAWVVPQQEIRPPQQGELHGLKPDLIVGGNNSDGFTWAVVELKGADARVFRSSRGRLAFTSDTNQAVFQLLEYLDYASGAQSYLRENLRLKDFRQPQGVLLVGRENEFEEPARQRMKAAWNREFGTRIQLRSYDALLRDVREWARTPEPAADSAQERQGPCRGGTRYDGGDGQ